MTGLRTILSFPVGGTRFNYRVAGAAIRDGHVLVCREDDDDYCMLPGGRVEMNEASDVALVREMAEELVMPVEVGRLLFTSESFYGREGDRYHELGFIYAIELPEDVRPALRQARDAGRPLALATLVAVGGGGPRPPGTQMVFAEGIVAGYFSGGCVESDVYEHAQEVLETGRPKLLSYGIADDEAWSVGLPCGGEIDVFVERLT